MAMVQGNIGPSEGCSGSQTSWITSKVGDGSEGFGERFQELVTERRESVYHVSRFLFILDVSKTT